MSNSANQYRLHPVKNVNLFNERYQYLKYYTIMYYEHFTDVYMLNPVFKKKHTLYIFKFKWLLSFSIEVLKNPHCFAMTIENKSLERGLQNNLTYFIITVYDILKWTLISKNVPWASCVIKRQICMSINAQNLPKQFASADIKIYGNKNEIIFLGHINISLFSMTSFPWLFSSALLDRPHSGIVIF